MNRNQHDQNRGIRRIIINKIDYQYRYISSSSINPHQPLSVLSASASHLLKMEPPPLPLNQATKHTSLHAQSSPTHLPNHLTLTSPHSQPILVIQHHALSLHAYPYVIAAPVCGAWCHHTARRTSHNRSSTHAQSNPKATFRSTFTFPFPFTFHRNQHSTGTKGNRTHSMRRNVQNHVSVPPVISFMTPLDGGTETSVTVVERPRPTHIDLDCYF